MKQLTNSICEIKAELVDNQLNVQLDSSQYKPKEIKKCESSLRATPRYLEGVIKSFSEEKLEIVYELPPAARSLSVVAKKGSELEKLSLARELGFIEDDAGHTVVPFIHPDNIFVISHSILIAHRGKCGVLEPQQLDTRNVAALYKALVIYLLHPKYKFEELVNEKAKVRSDFGAKIMKAPSIQEVKKLLDDRYDQLNRLEKATKTSVKKSRYTTFKVIAALAATVALITSIWLGMLLEVVVPRNERIIEAKAAFIVGNLTETVNILNNDEPETLPPSALYILASSYVQLDVLSQDQRQAILNNLSPSSDERELFYWIHIGRGEFDHALNLAYSINDIQLLIHAYVNRYNEVDANTEMDGIERQSLLNETRTRIEELVAELEGRDPNDVITNLPGQTVDHDENEEESGEENGEDD